MAKDSMIQGLMNSGIEYAQLKLDYYKVNGVEKAASIISIVAVVCILLFVAFFTYIFVAIAIGVLLSNYFNSVMIGFGMLAGVHLLVLILLFLFRKWLIQEPIVNAVIGTVVKD